MPTSASQSEKTIICYCAGGLGNRLLPIASCWAIAEKTGRQLRILWRDDDIRCQATFSELFSNKVETIFDNEFESLSDCKIYADINDVYKNHYLTGKKTLIHLIEEYGIHDRRNVVIEDDARHLIIYHNSFIEGVDIELSRRYIGQLNPVPQLQASINQAVCQLGISKDVMGVHARGTDFHISVAQYAEKIASVLHERPSQQFLVCSDNPAYEYHLKEQFPDNVIIRSKADHVRRGDDRKTWTNNTLTSNAAVKEAIIDIFLLAQTNFKIYHAGSSFARIIHMVRPVRPLAGSLMASKPETVPSPPRLMPTHLQPAYTMNGRIPIDTCYIDESSRNGNQHYTMSL